MIEPAPVARSDPGNTLMADRTAPQPAAGDAAPVGTRSLPRRARVALLVIWIGLLAGFGAAFWYRQRDEFARIGEVLDDIGPLWILGTLAVVPSSLALTVEIYRTLLLRLGAHSVVSLARLDSTT